MPSELAQVAVIGAAGFIGRNLVVRLEELGHQVHAITRGAKREETETAVADADVVFHLGAAGDAERVGAAIARGGRRPLVVLGSSSIASATTREARAVRASENAFLRLAERGAATTAIWRLPTVFGKWAGPDDDPIVATLCHNLSRGLLVTIEHAAAPLCLLYVDDLIDQWVALLRSPPSESGFHDARGVHQTTVGETARILSAFAEGRGAGRIENVGSGLERALYATFVAALPAEAFSYPLVAHIDARGSFAEVLKTRDGGQVSVLTARPGMTRGGHYHHSKVEKFLVVHGEARFRFRHIVSGETYELTTRGETPVVVETIPGWTHDVTNVGSDVMVSLLWASELFDQARPDTVMMPV